MTKKAAIIGGSIAGMFTALLLQKNGWHVDIYEKSPQELSGRGAGIITHPPLFVALKAIGIDKSSIGVPLLKRILYSKDGEIILQKDFPQISSSWDKLFSLLRSKINNAHYHLNKQLISMDSDGALNFTDGSKVTADIIIGADGIRSTLRSLVLPTIKPDYAGYIAWRGMAEEHELSLDARHQLLQGFTFCLPPNEQFLGYPVAGTDNEMKEGSRRFNYVWYQNADETVLSRLLTDDAGVFYPDGIPPPKLSKRIVNELYINASLNLAPILAEAVHLTKMPFFQQVYDLTVPKMVFGRVILLGDAAFVARPHVGAGVTKAAEDALVLSLYLTQTASIEEALHNFEQERLPIGHKIITQARRLGANKSHPQQVIDETASMHFLKLDNKNID